jgi:hypothetical protein
MSPKGKTSKGKTATTTVTVVVPVGARAIVYDVLHDLNPKVKPDDDVDLGKYGLDDGQSKDGLAQQIYQKQKVFVDYPTIEGCDNVGDVVKAVDAALKAGRRHA